MGSNKGNLVGAAIGAAIVGNALLKAKKNRDQKKAATAPAPVKDADVISEKKPQTPVAATRKCPSCGNADSSGSDRCLLCYASMDPNFRPEDI